jgi:hypothetical protein
VSGTLLNAKAPAMAIINANTGKIDLKILVFIILKLKMMIYSVYRFSIVP